jgi:hypothetical protein
VEACRRAYVNQVLSMTIPGAATTYSRSGRASAPVPLDYQDNFRWSNKCQALSFGGASPADPCEAGGQHDYTGSGSYMLGYVVEADTVLYEAYMNALKPIAP